MQANFYSFAAFGRGIDTVLLGGGPMATGGRKAMLSPKAQLYAEAIARVRFASRTSQCMACCMSM